MGKRHFTGTLGGQAAFLLSQLGFYSAARFTERLSTIGLHPRQYGMMVHLAAAEGQTQQQLADSMGIHRNVMVGLVDELESAGLVERRRHPVDRRAHALHLTELAISLLPEGQRLAVDHNAQLLVPLSDEQQRDLVSLLELIAAGVGLEHSVHPGLQA
jgi:DNA-binding MarR family transcriptional regulator